MTNPNKGSLPKKGTTITIFPPTANSECGCGSCGCGPTLKTASPAATSIEEFTAQLDKIRAQNERHFSVEVAQYGSFNADLAALRRLNEVFTSSGVKYTVSANDLGGILASYAPIIAVDDKIVSTGAFPEIEQMLAYLQAA